MKTVKNIPELRFPEFEGEWKERKLGELTSKIGSGSTPRGGDEIYQTFGIPFIRSQNLVDNQLVLDETCIPVEIHNKMIGSKVYAKDVLLNITGASIGRSCVVPENFTEGNVNQHVSIIRLKRYNPKFLQLFISSSRGQKLIYEGQTGSGREGLNFESIKRFKVHFPSPEEQQKIASFLSAADQRIQLLTQKKEKLEQYKKGIMQQIFSQQLRFKDENGKDYPEWEEKRLGDVASINMGQSPLSSSYNDDHNGIYLIQGNADIVDRKSCPRQWTTKPTKFCDIGDLLLTVRAPVGSIAKSIHNACIGRGVCAIRNKRGSDIEFLYQFFLYFESKWGQIEQGSTFTAISRTDIETLNIFAPILPEQQKIASFLSNIDQKISLVNQQIDLTRKWKQGLLQKMFV